MKKFNGIYSPIAVPFTEKNRVDLTGFEFNLEKWAKSGLSGIVFPGSNSEFPFLSEQEKINLWKISKKAMSSGKKKLIAGTGMESTQDTIRLTNIAADLGADASLIIPPSFYKSEMNHEVLVEHYSRVADESKIPIFIYNVPAFSGIDILAETIITLTAHKNIIGMKDSSSNVIKTSLILAAAPQFNIFCGTGGALLPFLSIGAIGGVMALANFASKPLIQLFDEFSKGNLVGARIIQHSLVTINTAITSKYGIPGLKYAMDKSGYVGGFPCKPLLPLKAEFRLTIDKLLEELEL